MREIKYRAYIKKDYDEKLVGKMLEVSSIHLKKKKVIIGYSLSKSYYGNRSFLYENIELMQFTGLHDENGKEIYEGDIVKFKHRDITIMAPVKYGEWQESKCDEYDCPHYGYYIDYKWDNYCENTGFDLYEKIVKVVGNIYENPELLKGADNIEL